MLNNVRVKTLLDSRYFPLLSRAFKAFPKRISVSDVDGMIDQSLVVLDAMGGREDVPGAYDGGAAAVEVRLPRHLRNFRIFTIDDACFGWRRCVWERSTQ